MNGTTFKVIDNLGNLCAELKWFGVGQVTTPPVSISIAQPTAPTVTRPYPGNTPIIVYCDSQGKTQQLDLTSSWPCGGKYQGQTWGDVIADARYIPWLMDLKQKGELRMKGLTRDVLPIVEAANAWLKANNHG